MNETIKNAITSNTFVSVGLITTIVAAAVSWGIMWQKVDSIEQSLLRQNLNSRVTILETTIPQINLSLAEIKDLLKTK